MKYVNRLSRVGPGRRDEGIGLVYSLHWERLLSWFLFSQSFTFNKFRLLSSSSNEQITEYCQFFFSLTTLGRGVWLLPKGSVSKLFSFVVLETGPCLLLSSLSVQKVRVVPASESLQCCRICCCVLCFCFYLWLNATFLQRKLSWVPVVNCSCGQQLLLLNTCLSLAFFVTYRLNLQCWHVLKDRKCS